MWIVVTGSLIDTTQGGGFEFIGPFDDEQTANQYREKIKNPEAVTYVVELLTP